MWRLSQVDRRRYPRNPLEVVLVQIRFHPILKLPDRISEFQDHVRGRFPSFADEKLKSVEIYSDGNAHVRTDQIFRFASVKAPRHIQLTTSSLTLEVKDYNRREDLGSDFTVGLQALTTGIGAPSIVRLGVRFINVVMREEVAAALGRDVSWPDLIEDNYLRVPDLFTTEPPRSYAELTAPLAPGALTLRYGLLPTSHATGQMAFRFDIDRYLEGEVEAVDIPGLLGKFTDDSFALFETFAAPALREWMEGTS